MGKVSNNIKLLAAEINMTYFFCIELKIKYPFLLVRALNALSVCSYHSSYGSFIFEILFWELSTNFVDVFRLLFHF